jgi:hypothetical protein
MAANAAASVVWLTAITLLSDLASAAGATLADLLAVLDSVFLFVTGSFNVSGAVWSAALDEGFAFDILAVAVVGATLATSFVAALLGVFALLAGEAEAVCFSAGFAIDLPAADLVAAEAAFFAVTLEFAVFFIAFAMESVPTELPSCAE